MLHLTYKQILQLARQLTTQDQQRLIASLETERAAPSARGRNQGDPFLALIGAWAEMGDDAISAFDTAVQHQRQELSRPVSFEFDV